LPHKAIDASGAAAAAIVGYLCRESEVAHVVMLATMAAMFAYPAGPIGVWRAVFAGIGLAFIVRLIASRSCSAGLPGGRVAAACYQILAAAAMLYATIGHANHAAAADMTAGSGGPPVPVLGWIFVVVFALDALMVAGVAIAAPARFQLSRPRLIAAAFPQAVMDFAMIAMLSGALADGTMSMACVKCLAA
jgi:hypothetical protein